MALIISDTVCCVHAQVHMCVTGLVKNKFVLRSFFIAALLQFKERVERTQE